MNRSARRAATITAGALLTSTIAILAATAPASAATAGPAVPGDGWAHAGRTPGANPNLMTPQAAPAGYPITGIDVSGHQTGINWTTVANAGAKFAYAKATEGNGFVSPEFSQQYNGAKSAGLYAGAYDYGRPDQRSGTSEADFFLDHAGYVADGRTLPPMLDIEWPWKDNGTYVAPYPCYGISTGAMVTWIHDFVNRVKARTGQQTMIYTNTNWWNQCTGSNGSFGDNPLFIANYSGSPGSLPAGWSRWTLWQYADKGSLPGDQDVFNGDLSQLAALAGGAGATPTGLLGDVNGDGRVDVLARDGNGALWLYPNSGGSGVNTFGTRSQVGTSWNGMSAIEVGDLNSDGRVDIVSREAATGALWLYPNTGGTGMNTFGARSQIGTGWNGMSAIGLGDLNSDGRVDVVSREATTGALWLYPNAGGTGMNTFGARSQVGSGWNGMSAINLGDLNSDGRVDVVSREATTGALWLYPNSGGTGINTFGPRSQVGSGWNGMSAINLGDLNSDGRVDVISREATTGALWLYPNSGGTGINTFGPRSQVGSSWNGMTDID